MHDIRKIFAANRDRKLRERHVEKLAALKNPADRHARLNNCAVIQRTWNAGQALSLHGWIDSLSEVSFSGPNAD